MKNKKTWEKELSNLLNKMSEDYLIDEEFEKELKWFITNALNQQREKGFMEGFNDCKKMVENGEHSHCCIIPSKSKKLLPIPNEGEGK